MNPHALVIGDVDNDNENEFVIGNLNGDLAIFKGECIDGFPSFVCRGLGTNSVVIINAEGHAHIFDIPHKSNQDQHQHNISVDDYLRGGRRSSDTASIQAFRRMMSGQSQQDYRQTNANTKPASPYIHDLGKPNLTLKVPVNVNKILIADIDHDDLNELILARTDRILHAFQLVPSDFSNTPFDHMYKGIQTPSISSLSPSASTTSLIPPKKINLLDKNMWVFDGQISSLCTTTHPDKPNEPLLLVAQPGNTFTIIDRDGKRYNRDFTPQQSATPNSEEEHINIEIFEDESTKTDDNNCGFKRSNYVVKNWPLLDSGGGNNNDGVIDDEIESGAVATEIVMGKRHLLGDSFSSSEVGMLSMDGKFSIYDLRTKTTSQRDLFVTHKLFSLATLDVSTSTFLASKSELGKSSFGKQHTLHQTNTGTQTPMSGTSHLRFATTDSEDNNADDNNLGNHNKRADNIVTSGTDSSSSGTNDEDDDDSDYESVPWSEGSEIENEPGCDLFVACAWNGVTYLIDWSKRIGDEDTQENASKIKYQLVKFAFEGRVCAFTAGLYCVENQVNVPCLFYVDFEDQIYVYYDVRISPGPVTGFIDRIDDDVEEALDRIIGIESGIDALTEANHIPKKKSTEQTEVDAAAIDLGDGWQGIADEEDEEEDEETPRIPLTEDQQKIKDQLQDTDPISKLAIFWYNFDKKFKCFILIRFG
ncbi:uncharacterized protein EV154DRAFT_415442 [Mucor mucedo]|uniref:uncharacterized protein n=1 Tax=Mucor mucedo TaxID=29922 RepID=UPI00221F6D84|nr:uncharacterized protein EV154DRAFT_415442 [Mucor mucedo]KAI7894310.1 hypothetical protein EV154DRAFT_415442 [Mucor mucedo]